MTRCSRVLQTDPWTGSNRKDGRLQVGRVDEIKSEPGTTSSRYTWTDCIGIRTEDHETAESAMQAVKDWLLHWEQSAEENLMAERRRERQLALEDY